MNKQQKIWIKNTLQAAFGAVILSALLLYAFFTDRSVLSGPQLALVLALFWFVVSVFLGLIISGLSMRFRDGSLTLPQMVWAISTTLLFMSFSKIPGEPFYLLLVMVMTFGVFQLKPKIFFRFAFFTSVALGAQKLIPFYATEERVDALDLVFNWCAFMVGMLILTSMCQSIFILRSRLKDRHKRLEDALTAKNMLLANMSHELRTPINGVVGMLKLLERTPLDDKQQHYLQLVQSSSVSLMSIVNDILDFSKIDAGKLEIESVEFNIQELVNDAAETSGHSAQQKGIDLILDSVDLSHSRVYGDPVRVRQIINNLTSNALKFTKRGEIVIRIASEKIDENSLKLSCSVSDTGVGIPERKIQLIFESFSQADISTTREFGGTGLGLSIVKKLCQLMRGDISVASREGEGSCFSFNLVLDEVPNFLNDEEKEKDLAGKTYFIVDASHSSCELLKRQLEHWGAKVYQSIDGCNALDFIRAHTAELNGSELEGSELEDSGSSVFNGIFIDSELPGMDVVTFCRELRALVSGIPITLMHPIGTQFDDSDMEELDLHYILSKPITAINLLNGLADTPSIYPSTTLPPEILSVEEEIKRVCGTRAQPEQSLSEFPPVLVVEDNLINQTVASGLFKMIGMRCDIAQNGKEALKVLRGCSTESAYALVFMDCQMPEMDGYEATRCIREGAAGEAYRNVPIIAMTANAMKGDKDRCLDVGMNDYLTKPIDVNELKKKVALWMFNVSIEYQKIEPDGPVLPLVASEGEDSSVWDLSTVLHGINGMDGQLLNLITVYLSSTPAIIKNIVQARSTKNLEDMRKLAHELKGASGNIGAKRLSSILARLELACREKELSIVTSLCEETEKQYQILVSVLEDYIASLR